MKLSRTCSAAAIAALVLAPLASNAEPPANNMMRPCIPGASSMNQSANGSSVSDVEFMRAVRSLSLSTSQEHAIDSFADQRRVENGATPAQQHVQQSRFHEQVLSVLTRSQVNELAARLGGNAGAAGSTVTGSRVNANGSMNGRENMSQANATTGTVGANTASGASTAGPGTTTTSANGSTMNGMPMRGRSTMSQLNGCSTSEIPSTIVVAQAQSSSSPSPMPMASATPQSGGAGGAGSNIPGKGSTHGKRAQRNAASKTGEMPGRSGAIPAPTSTPSPRP